jgi:hypothetical protein
MSGRWIPPDFFGPTSTNLDNPKFNHALLPNCLTALPAQLPYCPQDKATGFQTQAIRRWSSRGGTRGRDRVPVGLSRERGGHGGRRAPEGGLSPQGDSPNRRKEQDEVDEQDIDDQRLDERQPQDQ